jgi:acyl carrier protein
MEAARLRPAGGDLERETAIENDVRTLWMQVLEIDEMGHEDTFLDLGGESVAATLCTSQIKARFGVSVPISLLLDGRTTVASLAARIREAAAAST